MFMINNYYFVYFNIQCCMSAPTYILIKYAPAVSEVVYRHLEVVVGALKKARIYALCTLKKKEKKKKNNLCSMSVIK